MGFALETSMIIRGNGCYREKGNCRYYGLET